MTPAVAPATRTGEACAGKTPYQRPPAVVPREAGDGGALGEVSGDHRAEGEGAGVAFWKATAPVPRVTSPVVISAAAARVPA